MGNWFEQIFSVFTAIGKDIIAAFGSFGDFISGLSGWMSKGYLQNRGFQIRGEKETTGKIIKH